MSEAQIYTADEVNELFKDLMSHKNDKLILISIPIDASTWSRKYEKIYSINLSGNSGGWMQLGGQVNFLTKPGNFLAYWTNSNSISLRIIYNTSEFPNKIPNYDIYRNNSKILARPSSDGNNSVKEAISLTEGINYFVIK